MPRHASPALLPLHALTPGQLADCFAMLTERSKGATRDGKPYFSCRFRDARRQVSCMIWADGPWFDQCAQNWREGQFYKLRALYGEHERYGPQIELHNIRPITPEDRENGFDAAQLIESSRFPIETMFAELLALAATEIADEPLRTLVASVLNEHRPKLLDLPASEKTYYPFRGGWLEHTLSVTRSCILLADRYRAIYPDVKPPLNRDLVVAGAILHDLGRVVELAGELGAPQPTVEGKLYGHVLLGRDLVRDAARGIDNLNPELLRLLEHLILSHLTLPEWGSPRLPLIPECLILHHADDLDAKLEMYVRCLSKDDTAGPFTARDPVLGKPLLKGRGV
jgi:3'-5' exoribonuclease